jgi:hypothetical protein
MPKTRLDELDDALFDLPAILKQLDEISHEENQTALQDGFRDIIAKFLKVESTMEGLYRNFENSVSGPLYWSELSTLESHLDDETLGKVFPVSFHFPAFVVAQVVTTYWSGIMAVHHNLMFTYDKLASIESSTAFTSAAGSPLSSTTDSSSLNSVVPSYLRSHEHRNTWVSMVRNICQSAEYFLQDQMGELGSLTVLTLLSGCISCFGSSPDTCNREVSWIIDVMEEIKRKFRLPLRNLLKD